MSSVILIRGPICGGKSTTVDLLKRRVPDSSTIDFDAFKRQIDYKQSSDWRRGVALETALYMCTLLLRLGRSVIVDIHSAEINQYQAYKKLADDYRVTFASFLIYPPLAVCLQRNRTRSIPDVDYEISEEMITRHWRETVPIKGEPVYDSSKLSVHTLVDRILAQLESTHGMPSSMIELNE